LLTKGVNAKNVVVIVIFKPLHIKQQVFLNLIYTNP